MSREPRLGGLTRTIWQWVRREIERDVLAAGFTDLGSAHISVFRYPSAEGLRPTDLADDMQISKQSVNELLAHLERTGYIERRPDPHDNRSKRVHLTARGKELERVVWRAAERAEHRAGELLGEERFAGVRRGLADLVARLTAGADADTDAGSDEAAPTPR